MRWKLFLGLVMMLLSIGAMYMWESRWRDDITLDEVLAASGKLSAGDIVSAEDLKVIKITPQSRLENGIIPENASEIIGKLVICDIDENQQLLFRYFTDFGRMDAEDYRVFVLKSAMISSRPQSLAAEDYISIYALPSKNYLGTFEITKTDDEAANIEINAKLEDYYRIYDETEKGNSLLLVKEEKHWEK